VNLSGRLEQCDLKSHGLQKLCRIEITMPEVPEPECLTFSCEITTCDGQHRTANQWDLWLFPNIPDRIAPMSATVCLDHVRLNNRYTQIADIGDLDHPETLVITDHLNEKVLAHLDRGGDVLLLYRLAENRSRHVPRETHYLPSTWDRFKGTIWDRGHNCGGLLRDHPVLADFPHDGMVDWQLYDLIEDCDKIDLDDFPVPMIPIIEGLDKMVRDRFDVGRFNLSEFQYAWTMRKFGYLFELNVGKGRLMVSGLNFKAIERDEPASCWLFENIIRYMQSDAFAPTASLSVEQFEQYLLNKGRGKRIKERMMTQYWQLDDAPLESKQYWKESEQWLRENGV
jgi:beta-galactosidase